MRGARSPSCERVTRLRTRVPIDLRHDLPGPIRLLLIGFKLHQHLPAAQALVIEIGIAALNTPSDESAEHPTHEAARQDCAECCDGSCKLLDRERRVLQSKTRQMKDPEAGQRTTDRAPHGASDSSREDCLEQGAAARSNV